MHEQFLLAALQQARLGQGQCAPNPSVGAVAVQNGEIIAQAWHHGAGTPHAEHLLLAQIAPNTPGVSLYITLEPCNHWGRTPPCVDAIIKHGIERVIFAYLDPNPVVANNNSSKIMREQGIQVEHHPVPEITEFYKSYTHWIRTKRPRITVKMAQTFDGKIAGSNGQRIQLSNALCQEFTHQMRAASDVILTTSQTILMDNPQMNVRIEGKVQSKAIAILDGRLTVNPEAEIFKTASHCHVYYNQESIGSQTPFKNNQNPYSRSSFYPIPQKDGKMDLKAIITHLGALGYHDVWVEAGGTLFTALHQEKLVDRTYLYLVPKCLGPNAISAYQSEGIFESNHTISWRSMGDNMIACIESLEV